MLDPTLLFFLKIAETIQGLFWFHVNFWNIYSTSIKYAIGILIKIVLNLYIILGNMDTIMMLILPIHEHGTSFHLFVSTSVPFDPAIPLLGIYPKNPETPIQKNLCTLMFIAVLFTIAKICKQPKCLSVSEWIKKKVWYIYTME